MNWIRLMNLLNGFNSFKEFVKRIQVIDESVDAHTHCITFGQTSLLHVKDLFGAYLRYASLVLDGIIITLYGNCRISVSLTVTIDKQTIAFSIVFTFFQMTGNLD